MCAGLESNDQSRTSSPFACIDQRFGFGVSFTVRRMPPLADRLVSPKYYSTNEWILLDPAPSSQSQVEGTAHGLPLVHRR